MIVLYHGGCFDGFCAAWIARQVHRDAQFIPAFHGTEPPDVTGHEVYLLDFCYKRDTMVRLCEQATRVVVLDHHITAPPEVEGLPLTFVYDVNKSGARLAAEYFLGKVPVIAAYVEDRDLWRWRLRYTHEVNSMIRLLPYEFDAWTRFADQLNREFTSIVHDGEVLCRYVEAEVLKITLRAWTATIDGHDVPCVNTGVYMSEVGEALCKDKPFAATYFDRADGKRIWSLRSRGSGLDVSKIAKMYGGGGHKQAAGFQEDLRGTENRIVQTYRDARSGSAAL